MKYRLNGDDIDITGVTDPNTCSGSVLDSGLGEGCLFFLLLSVFG